MTISGPSCFTRFADSSNDHRTQFGIITTMTSSSSSVSEDTRFATDCYCSNSLYFFSHCWWWPAVVVRPAPSRRLVLCSCKSSLPLVLRLTVAFSSRWRFSLCSSAGSAMNALAKLSPTCDGKSPLSCQWSRMTGRSGGRTAEGARAHRQTFSRLHDIRLCAPVVASADLRFCLRAVAVSAAYCYD